MTTHTPVDVEVLLPIQVAVSECWDCGRTDGGCDRIVEVSDEITDAEGRSRGARPARGLEDALDRAEVQGERAERADLSYWKRRSEEAERELAARELHHFEVEQELAKALAVIEELGRAAGSSEHAG